MHTRVVMLSLPLVFAVSAAERPGDWTGNFAPCDRHEELLKTGRMNLGVRFSTSNPKLAVQFTRAMDFWAAVVDMTWRHEDTRQCAIQVVDGESGFFKPLETARAQFPWTPSFQGWIAFNPRISLPDRELFFTAVHEVGHLLGLLHNANPNSVMYFLSLYGAPFLDDADLAALAARHQLRPVASQVRPPTEDSPHRH